MFENFENLLHFFLMKSAFLFCFVFHGHKENIVTIEIEDGREAPVANKSIIFIFKSW